MDAITFSKQKGFYKIMKSSLKVENIRRERLLEVIRQNIAGWCQQTSCFHKFVENIQQCFALTPEAIFPAHNLNFHFTIF